MLVLATMAAMAILNRARGDDRWKDALGLPGRALFYIAPAVAVVALVSGGHSLPAAVAFGAAYLLWALGPWGFLYDPFGSYTPNYREVDNVTAFLLDVTGSKPVAFFLRNLAIWPGLAFVAYLTNDAGLFLIAPLLAAVIVGIYGAAWRLFPKQPILAAELGAGALWGALIAVTGG